MIGGLKQTTSRLAIATAAGLFAGGIALTPVQAASLGGDCCADLEERVAELEATTVRKGNRKVSVKLSGQVNRMVLWWDDGQESDVFFVDNENSSTRIRITGSARISPKRRAGFRIEADWFISNNSTVVSNCGTVNGAGQCRKRANSVGNTAGTPTDMRWAEIWFKSDSGKLSLGQGSTASDGTSEVDLSGTVAAQGSLGTGGIGGAFVFNASATGLTSGIRLGATYSNFDGSSRRDRVRYDSPSIGGFTFAGSVSADDVVDGAVRYKKEWNSVRCAWALGIVHDTQEATSDDFWQYSTSGSCIHTPSGLNLTIAFAERDNELAPANDPEMFFIKGGIYRRWNSHGKTGISVQYTHNEDMRVVGDETESFGVAIVQKIDSAALELYAAYVNWDYNIGRGGIALDDIDFFYVGARMKY